MKISIKDITNKWILEHKDKEIFSIDLYDFKNECVLNSSEWVTLEEALEIFNKRKLSKLAYDQEYELFYAKYTDNPEDYDYTILYYKGKDKNGKTYEDFMKNN